MIVGWYTCGVWFFAGYLYGRPELWARDHWSARLLGCFILGVFWPIFAALEVWLRWRYGKGLRG